MNTPRVKKQQQQEQLRKSLSAKKGPVKGVKNVLAQPYETKWPVLKTEDESRLEELLNRLLPGLRRPPRSIPWSQLRKMSKDERCIARKKLCSDSKDVNDDNAGMKIIVLGINAVTRGLEQEKLCSVLLDSGTESLLIKHVVILAQNQSIPILMVPFLKKVTQDCMGFASAAIGLKHEAMDSTISFHEIYKEIVKYPQAVPSKKNVVTPLPLLSDSTSTNIKNMEMPVSENNSEFISLPTNVYIYRNTRKERIFVPTNSEKMPSKDEEWGEFIALGEGDTEMIVPELFVSRKKQRYMDLAVTMEKQAVKNSKSTILHKKANGEESPKDIEGKAKKENMTYLPLKVKRIQGNNNRTKATKLANRKKKKSSAIGK